MKSNTITYKTGVNLIGEPIYITHYISETDILFVGQKSKSVKAPILKPEYHHQQHK